MRLTTHAEPVNQAVSITVDMPLFGQKLTLRSDCHSRPIDRRWVVRDLAPGTVASADVAGQQLTTAADNNGTATLVWDGRDAQGRLVATATTSVLAAGHEHRIRLGRWDSRAIGLGGFLLNGYDHLDVEGRRIRTGWGRLRGSVALYSSPTGYAVPRNNGAQWAHFDSDGFLARVDDSADVTIASWIRDQWGVAAQHGIGSDLLIRRSEYDVILERDGFRGVIALDDQGRVRTLRDSAGNELAVQWDERGMVAELTDPAGFAYGFEYDDDGRLVTIRRPGCGPTKLMRTATEHGHRVTILTAELRESTYTFETLPDKTRVRTERCCGRPTRVTRISGSRTEFDNGDGTRIVSDGATGERRVVLPSGLTNVRTKSADTLTINGRVWRREETATESIVTTPEGRASRVVRDGAATHIERPGTRKSIHYDERRNITEVREGEQAAQMHSNAAGFVTAVAYNDGRTTTFDYDDAGWLSAQHLPGDRTIRLHRGPDGSVRALTPPGAGITHLDFDAPDRLSGVRFADSTDDVIAMQHDRDGHLVSRQFGAGTALQLRRDSDGLVHEVIGKQTLARFAHHNGRPVRYETGDGSHVTSLHWDGPLLTGITSSGSVSGWVARSYDTDFLTSGISCGGLSAAITRDRDGLVVGLGPATVTRADTGEIASIAAGTVAQRWERDELGRVQSMVLEVAGQPIWQVNYRRDALHRIAAMSDTQMSDTQMSDTQMSDTDETAFQYDVAGRVVAASGPAPFRIDWDANGNIRTFRQGAGEAQSAHDSADRMTNLGGLEVNYDGAARVSWVRGDVGGQHSGADQNAVAGRHAGSGQNVDEGLSYDERGQLIGITRRDAQGAATTTHLVRDGWGNVITMGTGDVTRFRLLPGPDGYPDAVVDRDGRPVTLFVGSAAATTPLLAVEHGRTLLIASDHLGSVRFVVDVATGQVVEERVYDHWGMLVRRQGDAGIPFGWGGGLQDEATCLVHFPARTYSPLLMRFLSRDPLLFHAGSTNLYEFVGGDSINRRDPMGLQQVQLCRQATDMFVGGAEHWWIKQGGTETGMGQSTTASNWSGIPNTVEQSEGNRSSRDGVTCDDVTNVDEKCVAQEIGTGADGYGDELGMYNPVNNTCQDWVHDVLDKCSDGKYKVETDSPEAYDHWYNPGVMKSKLFQMLQAGTPLYIPMGGLWQ